MLMSQEEAYAQLLLRVSAAVLAWPTPLENVASSEDLLGQAVLATIRDMCTAVLSREEPQGSEAETAADTDSGTSSAINVDRGACSLVHLAYLLYRQDERMLSRLYGLQKQSQAMTCVIRVSGPCRCAYSSKSSDSACTA